ncbi:MAG TPA: HAMP domain-containing sensor histidine kinase [Gemmatimonadaceae bacterium]|jgi:two-component system nitrogen regulation sensor histidine kinase NtrY|nr:HAMP domain-containing sensor histidine kinase [Gemmatimonadaceae bacterium]
MTRFGFRTRLFLILALFAMIPSVALTVVWGGALSTALPLLSGTAPWERVAATGERAVDEVRSAPLTPAQRAAMAAHEQELRASVTEARRYQFLATRAAPLVGAACVVALLVLAIVASRVAGHLSRQLSRPLDELVGWTDRIARALPLPAGPPLRGAPEFEVLRARMRTMAADLEVGRARALEAERLRAFRETARQVAHELKNPLTPIRLAVMRLKREAPPALAETVDVLAVESARLEAMARSFSQFGHLPEGPAADVDIGDLLRYAARSTVPPTVPVSLDVDAALPLVRGHHDALARAVSNVLLNAVDACGQGGMIAVRAEQVDGCVRITVRDTGIGIPPARLSAIWEPYVTHKPGGTGLGLAIVRQTVIAHHGAVDASSEPGKGTEIRLTIPIS